MPQGGRDLRGAGAASAQLIGCSVYSRLIPEEEKRVSGDGCEAMILKNLRRYYDTNKRKKVYPTFWATVEAVVRHHGADREKPPRRSVR